jgi:hypothetical protein
MPDYIRIALQELQLTETHAAVAMKALGHSIQTVVDPPSLVNASFEYPAGSGNRYRAILTQPHAEWIQQLLTGSSSPDDVLAGLGKLQAQLNQFIARTTLPGLDQALTDVPRAKEVGAGGSPGDPPLGCCTLSNGTRLGSLTESQCSAYGQGAEWEQTVDGTCL